MNVKQLLEGKNASVATVGVDETILEAAGVLAKRNVGALIAVGDDESVAGIISERDIAKGLDLHGREIVERRVEELMTRNVVTCAPDESIINVMWRMTNGGFRHLPVLVDGSLVGIISIRDVMAAWLNAMKTENDRPAGVTHDAA